MGGRGCFVVQTFFKDPEIIYDCERSEQEEFPFRSKRARFFFDFSRLKIIFIQEEITF